MGSSRWRVVSCEEEVSNPHPHTTDEEEATPDVTHDPFASKEGDGLGEDDPGYALSSTTKGKHSERGLTMITPRRPAAGLS